ncbi:hypothetical protein CF319_g1388 [Tilletia indica]|nr:hypothetical protein CF319_g1388 [Tilletia indica]
MPASSQKSKRPQPALTKKAHQPAAKRAKHDPSSSSKSFSAAGRFFNIPELVRIIPPLLARDRIDLLQFGSTCKAFRLHALPIWAIQLDVPLSVADKRLSLFQANPGLAEQVRYLRFSDDIVDTSPFRQERHPRDKDHSRLWTNFAQLLSLIATEPPIEAQPPFLDLEIAYNDAYRISKAMKDPAHTKLLRRLVALKVICYKPHTPLKECEMRERSSFHTWDGLSDLIARAQKAATVNGGTGLRTFGFQEGSWHVYTPPWFWAALSPVLSHSLHELCFAPDKYDRGNIAAILPQLSFPGLKRCELGADVGPSAIQNFLGRHLALEHITITQLTERESQAIIIPQTFPSLSALNLNSIRLGNIADFLARHPQLERLKMSGPHSSRQEFLAPNLALGLKSYSSESPLDFETIARQGHSVSHIELCNADSNGTSTITRTSTVAQFIKRSWLSRYPKVVEGVTCLELLFQDRSLDPFMTNLDTAFSSSVFPNLSELYLSWGSAKLDDAHLSYMLSGLCTATSLRILRLEGPVTGNLPKNYDVLAGQTFPIALEYVTVYGWDEQDLHFRFVGEGGASMSLGKQGRLQRIPSVVHVIISDEGVWDEPSEAWRAGTILNHMQKSP